MNEVCVCVCVKREKESVCACMELNYIILNLYYIELDSN
jgi:hypothetical protein